MEQLQDDQFQLSINEESINAIANLITKVEKQVDQKVDRLLNIQMKENSLNTYDEFNQIIHQSSNIYNLCIQQLSGELQLLNLTPLANQYQRIFNVINKQLRGVLSCQKNLIEQEQEKEKRKIKAQKLMMIKNENKPQIPEIKRNPVEKKLSKNNQPLEQQIVDLLEQSFKEQIEQEKIKQQTQKKIIECDENIKDVQYKTQQNIQSLDDSLERKNWSMSRNYSGALDVYSNLSKQQKKQQQLSQDLMNGLKSYDNMDSSDDDNLTPEQREKKRRARLLLKFQNNLMDKNNQKSKDLNNLISEMTIYYEKMLKDQQQAYNLMIENFVSVKRIAYYLIDLINKCKCNGIDKRIVQKLLTELNEIEGKARGEIEFNQKSQETHQQSLQSMMNKQQMIQSGSSPVPGQSVVGQDGQVYKVDTNGNVIIQPQTAVQQETQKNLKASTIKSNIHKKKSYTGEESFEETKKKNTNLNTSQQNQGFENQGFESNIQPLVMEAVLPKGVKQAMDANGNPKLDKFGNPIFLDKSGKPVKLNEKQMKEFQESVKKIEKQKEKMIIPAGSNIVTQAVTKTIESKFIMKNGKKVEVFQNENGEFYTKDESGKPTILNEKEVSSIKTETKKVTVMETFIVDKTGKKQQVQLNEDGEPFFVDKSGRVINLNKPMEQQYENYQEVKVDKNGNEYIIDKKTGKQLIVQTNENGEQFVVNEKGEQVLINQPKIQKPQVKTDKNGKKYIVNEKGQKVEVFVNQFGEQCIKDANGFIIPVDQIGSDKTQEDVQMTQQVYENEKGEKFVLGSNGERLLIKQDDNGNTYFENSKGEKQLISKKALQQLEKKTPIIMNEKGEMFIKDKDGKIKEVVVNQFGEQFVKDENGQLVQINKDPSGTVKIPVQTDENGKQFIVDKKGNKITVNVDKNGNQFVIGDDGKKVIISKNVLNQFSNAKKTKVLKDTQVFEDDKGNKYVYDKFGQKQKVELGKNGKPFFRDANGNLVMVKAEDQTKIEVDENGNQFVTVNGQKQQIQVNKFGEKFFVNENGEVQIVQEPESEYESEDEPLPEYVGEDGLCKYCKQKYPQQIKHKGQCFVDENGNKYVLDAKGNKVFVKIDENGVEYYIDSSGRKFIISKFQKIVKKLINVIKIREFHFNNIIRKNFKISDQELIEKVMSLDDQTQQKLLKQFNSDEYQEIKMRLLPQHIDTGDLLEIYEIIRVIGGNYKMSDNEFVAKIKQFKTLHAKCENNCQHIDLYLKRLFVQNQMTKAIRNMKKLTFLQKRFKKPQQDNIVDKTLDLTERPNDLTIDKTLSTTINHSMEYQ